MTSDPLSPVQATGRPAPGSRCQWAGFFGAATLVCVLPAHAVDGVAADPISLTRTYHGSDGSFPGTEVFVTRNSRGNPAHTTNDMDMLKAAWQASLVGN
jgi:hypothetical protein